MNAAECVARILIYGQIYLCRDGFQNKDSLDFNHWNCITSPHHIMLMKSWLAIQGLAFERDSHLFEGSLHYNPITEPFTE